MIIVYRRILAHFWRTRIIDKTLSIIYKCLHIVHNLREWVRKACRLSRGIGLRGLEPPLLSVNWMAAWAPSLLLQNTSVYGFRCLLQTALTMKPSRKRRSSQLQNTFSYSGELRPFMLKRGCGQKFGAQPPVLFWLHPCLATYPCKKFVS